MKNKSNFLIVLIIFLLLIFLTFYLFFKKNSLPNLKKIIIGNNELFVEIADNVEKREKGLSGTVYLPKNQGMLFIFEKPGYYGFWMKGMKFSLDFIWIRENRVVEITKNVKPEDIQLPKVIYPKIKVDKVLEVNGGLVDQWGIRLEEKISF